MTRQIVRLDSNNTQQSINLEFDAEILSVINPTAQSIGVSVGGNIPPQTVQSADIWIPADSGINYPVVGRNFAAAFMPPLLVNAPTGIPTAANLFFTAQEAVPNFGAFPLSTLATQSLADVLLVPFASPANPFTSFSRVIQLTPDIQSLTLGLLLPSYNITPGTSTVIGATSGYIYWQGPNNNLHTVQNSYSFPVYPAIDSVINLVLNFDAPSSGAAIAVIGHRYQASGSIQPSGALSVGMTPGQYPELVQDTQYKRSATIAQNNTVVGPAVFTTVATVTIVTSGIYRVKCTTFSDDVAGAGKRMILVAGGFNRAMFGVGVGIQTYDLEYVQLNAGQSVFVQNAAAGGAGSVYFANIECFLP